MLSLERFSLDYFDSTDSEKDIQYRETVDEWPESMKVIDYLNRIREKIIDELTKAQQDTLSHYKLNSSHFLKSNDHVNELRSQVFKDLFYFQILYKPDDSKYAEQWIFNLYTFICDFYMSPSDINLLQYSLFVFSYKLTTANKNFTHLVC